MYWPSSCFACSVLCIAMASSSSARHAAVWDPYEPVATKEEEKNAASSVSGVAIANVVSGFAIVGDALDYLMHPAKKEEGGPVLLDSGEVVCLDGSGVAAQVSEASLSPVSQATTLAEEETGQLEVPWKMSPVSSCSEELRIDEVMQVKIRQLAVATSVYHWKDGGRQFQWQLC